MTIKLRAPEPDDVDRLYMWENDAEGGLHGHWAHAPLSRFQIWEYVNNYDANPATAGAVRMMVIAGDETVGTVDLYDMDLYNRRASVGIYIDPKRRGKGIGQSALEAIERYACDTLGLHTLVAYCLSVNKVGCRAFEAQDYVLSGVMKECARFGNRYHDINVYVKILTSL
ncbi:MAG: GNAT family N-acetyltransferase [Muribaculaceae bacterium]|nr:GNAT family N-acetyltransferase [Muribaculaceae bacterium]